MAIPFSSLLPIVAAALLAACATPSGRAGKAGEPAALLTGGRIVDPGADRPATRADVLIEGSRIVATGLGLRAPRGARRIDVRGAYLVPGLWDMHAHVAAVGPTGDALDDYVRHGVLAVRDMGGRAEQVLQLRDEVASGRRPGPSLFVAGPTLNGEQAADFHRQVKDGAEAREAVRELAGRGVDFIKIHRRTSREALAGVLEQARAAGLDVAGHVPLKMRWDEAAAAGMRTIEHIQTFLENEAEHGGDPVRAVFDALGRLDGRRGDEIFATMARHRTYWTPTLIYYETSWRDDAPELRSLKQRVYARMQPYVLRAYRAGVPILAGTDLLERRGEGLQLELERLNAAGLTPRQALAAATVVPFGLIGRGPGPIRRDGEASLLVLECDPSADLTCLRRIRLILLRGTVIVPAPAAPKP